MRLVPHVMLGVVAVLLALAAVSLLSGNGAPDGGAADRPGPAGLAPRSGAGVPPAPEPVRTFETPGGVRVLVLAAGEGEPVEPGQPIDLRLRGWTAAGTPIVRGVLRGTSVDEAGLIPGLVAGLAGLRPFERRRLLIPSRLAHGREAAGDVPAGADLVYDVAWVRLRVEDVETGAGEAVRPGDEVTVRYVGRLEDGTVFDRTPPGEPRTFALERGGLIDGWVFGLEGMREGGTRRLWIPWHLAYGAEGRGRVPPYADLAFEVELVDVSR